MLDTNVCIFFLQGKYGIKEKIQRIGSSAVPHGYVMVTENLDHFNRIPGIEIENWIVREQ